MLIPNSKTHTNVVSLLQSLVTLRVHVKESSRDCARDTDGVVHVLVRVRTRLCECALTFLNLSRGCLRGEDLLQFASTAKVLLARGDARRV